MFKPCSSTGVKIKVDRPLIWRAIIVLALTRVCQPRGEGSFDNEMTGEGVKTKESDRH